MKFSRDVNGVIFRISIIFTLLGVISYLPAQADPFVVHKSEAIVLDKSTGLVWMRCSLGQHWNGKTCTGVAELHRFDRVQQSVDDFNSGKGFSGYTDWVIPTIRQLHGLILCSSGKTKKRDDPDVQGTPLANWCDGGYSSPAINQEIFSNTPKNWNAYWSRTVDMVRSDVVWGVIFQMGSLALYPRESEGYVRLVRAGGVPIKSEAFGFIK